MLSNTTAIAEAWARYFFQCFLQEFISSEVCGNFRIATPKLMHLLLSGALFPAKQRRAEQNFTLLCLPENLSWTSTLKLTLDFALLSYGWELCIVLKGI